VGGGFLLDGGGTDIVTAVSQPQNEVFLLALLADDDGQNSRPEKPDLNSASRQLKSQSTLAKRRVWGAKLGLGAALLDELEKATLSFSGPMQFDIKDFLLKMLAAGKLEKALFDELSINDFLHFPDVDLTRPMSARAVGVNEALLRNEMSVGGTTALEMFNFWTGHSVVPPPLKNFASLDTDTTRTPSFVAAAERFERSLKENLREQFRLGLVDYHDLVTGPGPERVRDSFVPPREPGKATGRMLPAVEPILPDLGILLDTVVKICIGSFQGIRVSLSDFQVSLTGIRAFPGSFSGKLLYELRDHFGVDDEDCEVRITGIHGTPGQVAMWVLQHYAPSGHKPFIDQVLGRREFSGQF
jgi:hypothetical protein